MNSRNPARLRLRWSSAIVPSLVGAAFLLIGLAEAFSAARLALASQRAGGTVVGNLQ